MNQRHHSPRRGFEGVASAIFRRMRIDGLLCEPVQFINWIYTMNGSVPVSR